MASFVDLQMAAEARPQRTLDEAFVPSAVAEYCARPMPFPILAGGTAHTEPASVAIVSTSMCASVMCHTLFPAMQRVGCVVLPSAGVQENHFEPSYADRSCYIYSTPPAGTGADPILVIDCLYDVPLEAAGDFAACVLDVVKGAAFIVVLGTESLRTGEAGGDVVMAVETAAGQRLRRRLGQPLPALPLPPTTMFGGLGAALVAMADAYAVGGVYLFARVSADDAFADTCRSLVAAWRGLASAYDLPLDTSLAAGVVDANDDRLADEARKAVAALRPQRADFTHFV